MALDQRSLRLFEACSCKPTSEDLPPSLDQHRAIARSRHTFANSIQLAASSRLRPKLLTDWHIQRGALAAISSPYSCLFRGRLAVRAAFFDVSRPFHLSLPKTRSGLMWAVNNVRLTVNVRLHF